MSVGARRQLFSKGQRTRVAVIQAAERHFAARGYGGTSLEEIAATVGISPAAILYHFEDKEGLYRAVVDASYGPVADAIRQALVSSEPIPDRIDRAIKAAIDRTCARPASAAIALREIATPDTTVRHVVLAHVLPMLDLIAAVVAEGTREGVLAPRVEPIRAFSMISGAMLVYVAGIAAALPDGAPYDPLAPERIGAFEQDMLAMAHAILLPQAPSSARLRSEPLKTGRDTLEEPERRE
jgi:AcrR family transcriptional regulator